MASALELIESDVRELVRRRGLDPMSDPDRVRSLVTEVVTEYDDRALGSSLPPVGDARLTARLVLDAVAGFGPLQRYLDDPEVEEIWINEPGKVFIARRGRSELTTTILSAGQVAGSGRADAAHLGTPGRPVHPVRGRDAARTAHGCTS